MSSSAENESLHDSSALSGGNNHANGPTRNPPLVIVSERGRHSEASRRIVRAQAARASAAQSRETRARNREDRHAREAPRPPTDLALHHASRPAPPNRNNQSPMQRPHPSPRRPPALAQDSRQLSRTPDDGAIIKPLVNWITNVLQMTAAPIVAAGAALASGGRVSLGNANSVLDGGQGYFADSGLKMEEIQVDRGVAHRRLPIALPRGFATLQTRINIPEDFMVLLSRTACFDYASSGVEKRMNELLWDIVMERTAEGVAAVLQTPTDHPIQKHLRLACVCLTIFQGQRIDGATFASNQNYDLGLQAAWDEALVLDQDVLKEQKLAEAALWAVSVISVTCGSTVPIYHQLLFGLMQDLQLLHWNQVRKVLLDFIYPGSFIDAPMQQFYQKLHHDRAMAAGG